MSDWKAALTQEWNARRSAEASAASESTVKFPLVTNNAGVPELLAMVETILNNQLTMGSQVAAFEEAFAKWVGSPYAVMSNSGSSANLLAVAAMVNPERKVWLRKGAEVLVPAVCWSTSVFPLMQCGLTPVLMDCDPVTMNVDVEDMKRRITDQTKGIVMVHVLGNSAPMQALLDLCKQHELVILEDTCESLGSYATIAEAESTQRKMLGTFGDFGSYSFYFSHHMTTGEGGMTTCKTLEDYNLLRCLRAHGWTRHRTDQKEQDARFPNIDSRFNFINVGYNLRPMEVQGAMGLVQLKNLAEANQNRRDNFEAFTRTLEAHPDYQQQFSVFRAAPGTDPAWFGMACTLDAAYEHQQRDLLEHLSAKGIQNRPVISGNFARQPCMKLHGLNFDPQDYPGAEIIHTRGFFVGSHHVLSPASDTQYLVDTMLAFPWQRQ